MVFTKSGLLATFAATASAYTATQRTFAVNHFYGNGPLVSGRMDPIINPGTVSGHVHTIQGGSNFAMTMEDNTALESNCTSSLVKNDKSNYWTPSLFFQDPKNGTLISVPMFYMNVYYFFEPTTDKITAFQPGHRMVIGNPTLRSPPATGGRSIVDKADGVPQPIQWTCPRSAGNNGPLYPVDSDGLHGAGIQDPENSGAGVGFPDQNCDGSASPLRADIHFPSCYNPAAGLDNYKDNMDWPTNGICPEGYVHTPHLFYEVYWDTLKFADLWTPGQGTQPFVLAMGDPTGYGLHADFISGWDEGTLQQIIDNCNAGDLGMDKCPGLIGGLNNPSDSCNIPSPVDEVITGLMESLPGNNPITGWGSSGSSGNTTTPVSSAVSQVSSVASSVVGGATSVVGGVTSVLGGVGSAVSSALGVATSSASSVASSVSSSVSTASSSSSASSASASSASSLKNNNGGHGSTNTHVAGNAIVPTTVTSAGGAVYTTMVTVHATDMVYTTVTRTAGASTPTSSSSSDIVPQSISDYTYTGCYQDQESPSRSLSGIEFADVGLSSVTNTKCVTYCSAQGYSVAGTEYGGQCFCGNSLPPTTLDAGKCSMPCEGNGTETCGGSLALSVYSKSSGSKRMSRHLHRHVLRESV